MGAGRGLEVLGVETSVLRRGVKGRSRSADSGRVGSGSFVEVVVGMITGRGGEAARGGMAAEMSTATAVIELWRTVLCVLCVLLKCCRWYEHGCWSARPRWYGTVLRYSRVVCHMPSPWLSCGFRVSHASSTSL